MKAIVTMSVGCFALALSLGTVTAFAGTHPVVGGSTCGLLLVGQTGERTDAESRQEADKWLRQARKAMKDGNAELGEYYVERAERLNVRYDALFARFVDTPAKVRRDLAKMRSSGGAKPPSSTYSPTASSQQGQTGTPAPRDPFNGQAGQGLVNDLANDSKAKAAVFLANGKGALAQGDKAGAVGWYKKAVATRAQFAAGEYSPVQLAQELQRAGVSPEQLQAKPGEALPPFSFQRMEVADTAVDRLPPILPDSAANAFHVVTSPYAVGDTTPPATAGAAKAEALRLTTEARAALDRGDLTTANQLAQRAQMLKVPESAFGQGELRPWEVLLAIESAAKRQSNVVPATNVAATTPPRGGQFPVSQGLYQPHNDSTQNIMAQATEPAPTIGAQQLYQQGMTALESQDRQRALELFRQAWKLQHELDPGTRQQLKDKLAYLGAAERSGNALTPPSPLQEVGVQQELLRQKLFREIANETQAVEKMTAVDPRGALQRMQDLRDRVQQADLDPAARKQLLTYVDRGVQDLDTYIKQHQSEIDLTERNRAIVAELELDHKQKLEIQDTIAELIERFNTLVEEERFAEAELVANQVRELDPESPIARTLMLKSRFVARMREQERLGRESEEGLYGALTAAQESAVPFDDRKSMDFGDVQRWNELTNDRKKWLESQRRQFSPAELEIQGSLKQEVEVRFEDRPLKEVLETLGSMVGVNIYPDPQGLAAEGVTSDTPVSITLSRPISLQSALNLILEPLRLSYVVQNEVLLVTSEQTRDEKTYPRVYNVADLVIPIPNFVPGYNVGLPAAIREAHQSLGYGGMIQPVSMAPLTIASNETDPASKIASNVLANTNAYGMLGKASGRPSQQMGYGSGSMGGAAMADFDTLIELITSTIAPDSWDAVGGPGAIEPFPTNLSLVISQTQDVHDQIADLLEQLRRLQDLQVTIEVRFITLRDDFFERMGVDFDFDIDDNVEVLPRDDEGPSTVIGLDQDGLPTSDLDLSFTQGSFGTAVPAFGGFDATTAANFGFAILSDIEVFFLLQAAEGDTRSNVLQAPKVTLFNGQLASVNDTSQRPFVTSLIPVVGDFAAAHQPVIVVLSEGTSLSVQAVCSSDRRFVRLTLVPFFSQIGDVDTFTFDGATTTRSGSNVLDADGNITGESDDVEVSTEGTTVQLPTFSFTTVSTTVSVPDGGTVLLGGIKRLREGRNEEGVPMLSKLPYVNRLFKNVGIGRETQSLMLMVTPRIIIQEEEESKLGIEITP